MTSATVNGKATDEFCGSTARIEANSHAFIEFISRSLINILP